MIPQSFKTLTVSSAVVALTFLFIGCGGDSAPAPPAEGEAGAAAAPKAPPEKGKGGRLIESEDNTPKRLQGRDN